MKNPPNTLSQAWSPPSGGGGITDSVVTAVERGLRCGSASSWISFSCFSGSLDESFGADVGLEITCSSVEMELRPAGFFSSRSNDGGMFKVTLHVQAQLRLNRNISRNKKNIKLARVHSEKAKSSAESF
jgi:hypothetical protein